MRWLLLALFLSGCVPGCGGDSTGPEGSSGPVRLPPGMGGAEAESAEGEGEPVRIPPPSEEELADPPPVEPPP